MPNRDINTLTVSELQDLMKGINNATVSPSYAQHILGINEELLKTYGAELRQKVIDESIDHDLITFWNRLARIYHSCTGERFYDTEKEGRIEQMVFPDDNSVFFFIRRSHYQLKELVFCVQDVYFNVPTDSLPTGMGIYSQFTSMPIPDLAVDNVKGEIADFVDDYLDQYGTEDEFIPQS